MDKGEIESALQYAFGQCEQAGNPVNEVQRQIFLELVERLAQPSTQTSPVNALERNPLEELTDAERQSFLDYVVECAEAQVDWKAKLLNDWLQGQSSGSVQFIRDRLGLPWLEQIKPEHLSAYVDVDAAWIRVGDRLEICNTLWEWVPESQDDQREWYPCTVVRVFESADGEQTHLNCTVRLTNGQEYDINGIYEWNRCNWRWGKP
jgi:hypothetical protein